MIIEEDSEIITAIETTHANQDDGNELKLLLNQQKKAQSLINVVSDTFCSFSRYINSNLNFNP